MNPLDLISTTLVHVLSLEDYNSLIMVDSIIESRSVTEVCAHVKDLGYAASGRIRLYGEEFEVLSDPFPQEEGIAVHVKPLRQDAKSGPARVLQLPATIIQSVKGRMGKAA
jgi:hypothetical protein